MQFVYYHPLDLLSEKTFVQNNLIISLLTTFDPFRGLQIEWNETYILVDDVRQKTHDTLMKMIISLFIVHQLVSNKHFGTTFECAFIPRNVSSFRIISELFVLSK